jgi:hypothetical protein
MTGCKSGEQSGADSEKTVIRYSVSKVIGHRLAGRSEMSSAVSRTIRMLEEARVNYCIERTRPDSIRLSATMPGQPVEIDILEYNHIEISRFLGDEKVEGGSDLLKQLLNAA